jgi:hypothetical protein
MAEEETHLMEEREKMCVCVQEKIQLSKVRS